MRKDFFPKREDLISAWCRAFAEKLLASGGAYGVSEQEAVQFDVLRQAFDNVYREWTMAAQSGVRSVPLTASKRAARRAVEADARRLSRLIHGTAVADAQLADLGLSRRTGGGKNPAIAAPVARPLVVIESVVNRTARVRLVGDVEGRRGRPRGTSGAAVFIYYGPASDPTAPGVQWVFYDFATQPTLDVAFPDEVPPGKTVWIVAQWLSPRLQRGPMSQAQGVNLPGGGVSKLGSMKAA